MRLGLKEIGVVVALATAGCAEKYETEHEKPLRVMSYTRNNVVRACLKQGSRDAVDMMEAFIALGVTNTRMAVDIANEVATEHMRQCVGEYGLLH